MRKKNYSLRRWSIWGILVTAFIAVFFHRLSMGAVADDLSRELGLGGTTLSNITSMTFYSYALMQIPVGIMVDTVGVRKICSLGMAITAIGSVTFGFAQGITLAYISRFIIGMGTSVIIVSIMKVQTQWFNVRKFSTLSGITSFFGNFGALLATFPLTYLVSFIGWRSTFFVLGIITLVIALGIFLIVRDTPDELGFQSLSKNQNNKGLKRGILDVIKNKYTWPNFIIIFSLVGSTTAVLGLWGIPYISQVYYITKQEASWYLSFITIGFIIGAPIVGKLSDFLNGEKKKILYVTTCLFTMIWVYVLVVYNGKPPMEQLPVVFFIIGLCVITHILVFTNVKEVNNLSFSGIATAIVNVGEFLGSSLMSLMVGIILEKNWSGEIIDGVKIYSVSNYKMAFMFIILAGVISILGVSYMRDIKDHHPQVIK